MVSNIPDNTFNLRVILEALKLKYLKKKYNVVCDLKLKKILLGMTNCSSMHACPFCEGHKVDANGKKKGRWIPGRKRTIKNVIENQTKYVDETGCNRKLLQDYFNVEYPPMLPGDDDDEVLSLLTIPYLHVVLLCPFNTLWAGFLDNCGAPVKTWLIKTHMKGSRLGGDFNGPTVKEIIHSKDTLEDLEETIEGSQPFVNTLRCGEK